MLTIAYIPCSSEKEAIRISKALLKDRLIACANIYQSKSLYNRKEKLKESDEWVIFAKTMPEKFEEVRKTVKKLHSYELPCIIALPVTDFNVEYFDWVSKQVAKKKLKQAKRKR